MRCRVALLGAAMAALWCGCHSLDCEPGTFKVRGTCIVEAPVTCGEGTVFQGGQCISAGVTGCGRGTYQDKSTCRPVIDLSGNAARLVSLEITQPAVLNGVFEVDLSGYPAGDILTFLGIYAPGSATVRVYGGRGTLQPPLVYLLDRAEGFASTATLADGVVDSDPVALRLPLSTEDSLDLATATVSGAEVVVYDRLPVIARGEIDGVITPDAANRLIVNGYTLTSVLGNTMTEPDIDLDDDGTPESWSFAAAFEAEPVWLF